MSSGGTVPLPRSWRDALEVVAHELTHDVAEVRDEALALEALADARRDDTDLLTRARRLRTAVQRLERSLDQFLTTPDSLGELRLAQVRPAEIVRQVIAAHDPRGRHVVARLTDLMARLDPIRFERIVDNLVVNALQHTSEGSHVAVELAAMTGGRFRLTVSDDGPGAVEELRAALTDDGRTPGLSGGLGVVARFVGLHDGDVTVEPGSSGNGVEVSVLLPTSAPDVREDRAAQPSGRQSRRALR